MTATKTWAKNVCAEDLRGMIKDMIKNPTKWSKADKIAVNTEMTHRGLKIKTKKRAAAPNNPFRIPRGFF